MKRQVRVLVTVIFAVLALSGPLTPARAQEAAARPVGPCSPIAGPDGDIASDLPGCRHRRRPADGSLADEMSFRRGRGAEPDRRFPEEPE